jgi:hypothetical protein
MHSSLISKIQKANLYAREPDRVRFTELSASFQGEHDSYRVSFGGGSWSCSCNSFPTWRTCSHVMAMQKLIGSMLPKEATYFPSTEPLSAAAS